MLAPVLRINIGSVEFSRDFIQVVLYVFWRGNGGCLYLSAVVVKREPRARCCRIRVGEATGEVLPGSRVFIYPPGKFQNRAERGEEGSRNIDLRSGCGRKARLRQEKAGLLRQISRGEGGER
jgi:hypothetical protein